MQRRRAKRAAVAALMAMALGAGCRAESAGDAERMGGPAPRGSSEARAEAILERAREQVAEQAVGLDSTLRRVPGLSGAERASLRRFLNAAQLARARALGVPRPAGEEELAALLAAGRLVPLPNTTERWVVRELDHSVAMVTPDARALLEEIGARFQARLDSLGVPLRLEVTSVLRTAETQARLRGVNSNAARGVSTHEFGTTLDLAYADFSAPAGPPPVELGDLPGLREHLALLASSVTEAVAARRAGELQAVLGRVLREMQSEGKVMVTMERQQTVYHITVARRLAGD